MLGVALQIGRNLTRLDACALVFASVLLPLYFERHDLVQALSYAIPVFTSCMSGFILNNLADIERDRENHPDRALPRNSVGETAAALFYFAALLTTLILIKILVPLSIAYLYVVFLLAFVNYNYVVSYFPIIKTLYVAAVGLFPLLILIYVFEDATRLRTVIPSLFLFLPGREILMDIADLRGDRGTLPTKLGAKTSEQIGFILIFVGSLLLFTTTQRHFDFLIGILIMCADFVCLCAWSSRADKRTAINLTKIQFVLGMYYLF